MKYFKVFYHMTLIENADLRDKLADRDRYEISPVEAALHEGGTFSLQPVLFAEAGQKGFVLTRVGTMFGTAGRHTKYLGFEKVPHAARTVAPPPGTSPSATPTSSTTSAG